MWRTRFALAGELYVIQETTQKALQTSVNVTFYRPTLTHHSVTSRSHINYSSNAFRSSPTPCLGSPVALQVTWNMPNDHKHSHAAWSHIFTQHTQLLIITNICPLTCTSVKKVKVYDNKKLCMLCEHVLSCSVRRTTTCDHFMCFKELTVERGSLNIV
jgi:hypothetical protein